MARDWIHEAERPVPDDADDSPNVFDPPTKTREPRNPF